jgi:hypothetical protein
MAIINTNNKNKRAGMARWMYVMNEMSSSSYICVFFFKYRYDSKTMIQNSVERRAKIWDVRSNTKNILNNKKRYFK